MRKMLFGVFAVLMLVSCKKEIDEMPETTATGANTFGAKIDGKLWGPLGFGITQTKPILEAHYYVNGNKLVINARNLASAPNESEMEIYIHGVGKTGEYILNENTAAYPSANASYIYYVERRITPLNEWITSESNPGVVTITRFDMTNKIVAGTFSFKGSSMGLNPKAVTVTEGRFDVTFP